MIDLRSDTVTRPTPHMRAAMAAAEVGDDHYREDPTVNALEERAAELFGFEAALFVPSGTMGNQIALRLHARHGEEVLVEARSHVVQHELGGLAALSGIVPRVVATDDGRLAPSHVRAALRPRSDIVSDVKALVLENTHNMAGGTVSTPEDVEQLIAVARESGMRVHIDGARIWNAAVALGVPLVILVRGADTVMACLSKGLCCPVGSLLFGSQALIAEARRVRKQLGGGLRQAGVLAAAGLVALDTLIPRLAEDHENARRLAEAFFGHPDIDVVPPRTNIVMVRLRRGGAPRLAGALRDRGVLVTAMDAQTLRLVTHHDVSASECDAAAHLIDESLGRPAHLGAT